MLCSLVRWLFLLHGTSVPPFITHEMSKNLNQPIHTTLTLTYLPFSISCFRCGMMTGSIFVYPLFTSVLNYEFFSCSRYTLVYVSMGFTFSHPNHQSHSPNYLK